MAAPDPKPPACRPDKSPEAIERRRRLLQAAMHESEMEGIRARDPETDYLQDAYIAGDMTTDEMIAALDRHYKPQVKRSHESPCETAARLRAEMGIELKEGVSKPLPIAAYDEMWGEDQCPSAPTRD